MSLDRCTFVYNEMLSFNFSPENAKRALQLGIRSGYKDAKMWNI